MRHFRTNRIGQVVLILAVLMLAITTLNASSAPSAVEVQRHVIAGGGGRSEAGNYALHGTIGQPVAGTTGNSPYDLCAGFWCGGGMETYKLYIPLAMQDS